MGGSSTYAKGLRRGHLHREPGFLAPRKSRQNNSNQGQPSHCCTAKLQKGISPAEREGGIAFFARFRHSIHLHACTIPTAEPLNDVRLLHRGCHTGQFPGFLHGTLRISGGADCRFNRRLNTRSPGNANLPQQPVVQLVLRRR